MRDAQILARMAVSTPTTMRNAMELALSDDQEFFRDTTRKFLASECPIPKVRALRDDPAGFEREYWRRGAELGWMSLLVPEEFGGGSVSENGLADLALVAERSATVVAALPPPSWAFPPST